MILVTGGTGTIGKATVAALQAAGQKFKVAARSPQQVRMPGVDSVTLDWSDLDTYLPAMKGVDRLFLLTPNSERQVGYAVQTIAAAKRAGVKHIVRLSVMGADADPGIILGRLHFAAEKEVKLSGIPWTMLRPTFFMQNFINYYGVFPNKDCEIHLPNGQGKAAWVDARDVGEVAAKVLTTDGYQGKAVDLTGPEALTTSEVLTILSEVFGHKYTYVDVPEDTARKAMEEMKMPLWLVDGFMELHGLIRNGQAGTIANGVQEILGRPPRSVKEWAQSLAAKT
ncbi:MAG: family NAD(P)-dependent oxidoreductase [Burkholderia sp.]|nr:family NAD(P)-dependent oxidoreductase [Burkholderia sp.]